MASEKWIASCHRRTVSTMRKKVTEMLQQWEGNDPAIYNELHWLCDYLANCEELFYFKYQNKDQSSSKSPKK